MDLTNATVGVVGGTGRMGSWISGMLERRGHRVFRSGRTSGLTLEQTARLCRVVILSVPVESTTGVAARIGPMLPPGSVLMDLTSVKDKPLKAMLENFQGEVVGLHPLFGPTAGESTAGLTVAVCPGRGTAGLRWIEETLRSEGYRVERIHPEEHDRIMGVVQGANHFMVLAFALFLGRCGVPVGEIENWSTPSFRVILDRIHGLLDQGEGLFRALLTENPASLDAVDACARFTNQFAEMVKGQRKSEFTTLFHELERVFNDERRMP